MTCVKYNSDPVAKRQNLWPISKRKHCTLWDMT